MSQHKALISLKLLAFTLSLITFGLVARGNFPRAQVPSTKLDAPQWKNFFSVTPGDPVALRYSATTRYQLDNADSAAEFVSLLPNGQHTVYIDDDEGPAQPYTVTLFHQLKCLDIIRRDYISPPAHPLSSTTRHCLNYLRQTILCRPNIGLESTKNSQGTAARSYESVCADWSEVYKEAERNHAVYHEW
ncbi:Oxidase ustYa [Hypsizygus marmoreus]|uniref:Oxidase ustYa n=1 Tax=Hypsizygus marmoreus TaxID=39966 RepID=A0A369JX26_HYPMA|nr:Oxidase ustYa [Hypsizygus marmoreus]